MHSDQVNGPRHAELTPILDTVLDAVVVIGLDGIVVAWNAVAEKMFGWTAPETIGRSLAELIVPPQHREAHNLGIRRLLAGEAPRVLNRLIEISALAVDGRELPVELSITTTQTSDGPLFVGFLRDITAKKLAEEALRRQASEAQLMFDVARMAAEAESFEEALEKVLSAICEISGWAIGHAFLVQGDPPRLVSTEIWYESTVGEAERLRSATRSIEFSAGVGLPGKIVVSGEPLWVADVGAEDNFPRARLGFQGAFGFPLKSRGRTIAILEFFAHSAVPPDNDRLLTVRILGEQMGRIFERRQREDRERLLLHELNHRVKNQLTVIQAIASQTFRKASSLEEGLQAFNGRLRALAGAQDLILAAEWSEVRLRDLLEAAIRGSGNTVEPFEIAGPDLKVSVDHTMAISLAVHELCTNSVKYGSLSTSDGRVQISWSTDDARDHVRFEWRELGGPPVTKPAKKGFGSTLLVSNLNSALGGEVQIDYAPDGLVFRVHAPLSGVNKLPA